MAIVKNFKRYQIEVIPQTIQCDNTFKQLNKKIISNGYINLEEPYKNLEYIKQAKYIINFEIYDMSFFSNTL